MYRCGRDNPVGKIGHFSALYTLHRLGNGTVERHNC